MEESKDLIPFEGKPIRKIWHNEEWYFSIIDVIEVLTDSSSPKTYWAKLKTKELKDNSQTFPFTERLKLIASDGRKRLTDCADTKGILRIVMSVSSPKVEPLKLWLAEVGKERIQETENPELSFERMREIYRAKGRTENWIAERLKTVTIRNRLTDEWKTRGVKEGQEYGILTAEIAKGTFDMTPSEYGQFKGLDKQNLRDHMTPFELILTSLSEEITRSITVDTNAQGFNENHEAAVKGGYIGGRARKNLEADLGKSVISSSNFLKSPKDSKDELPPSNDIPKD